MIKNAQQFRVCIFLFIIVSMLWGYQTYFNFSVDKEIDNAIEEQNNSVNRYFRMIEMYRAKNKGLTQRLAFIKKHGCDCAYAYKDVCRACGKKISKEILDLKTPKE
jgi:hypothetical protein